jgi:hypothetical protein
MLRKMRRGVVGHSALAVVIVATVASCHHRRTDVEYVTPAPTPPPRPHGAVTLQVYVRRPQERGGLDPEKAGWVRGKWSIPTAVRVAPDAISRNIWSATADALARAGIDTTGGPNRLCATVFEFWEDGVGGSGTHVVVFYQLVDASNRELWNITVRSGTGEPGDPSVPTAPEVGTGPVDPGLNMFTYALAELAVRANAAFIAPAFQQAAAR